MAPKREIVDPAYDTLALSESDDDLDSEEIEDAPVCDDPHAALRRVSSAFDAKVAHLTSPGGLAPPDATAVTLERLTAQSKGVDEELAMLADAAGLRSVCDLYAAAEDEEIEARARRDKSRA